MLQMAIYSLVIDRNVRVKLALMGEVQLCTVTPIYQKMGRNLLK